MIPWPKVEGGSGWGHDRQLSLLGKISASYSLCEWIQTIFDLQSISETFETPGEFLVHPIWKMPGNWPDDHNHWHDGWNHQFRVKLITSACSPEPWESWLIREIVPKWPNHSAWWIMIIYPYTYTIYIYIYTHTYINTHWYWVARPYTSQSIRIWPPRC